MMMVGGRGTENGCVGTPFAGEKSGGWHCYSVFGGLIRSCHLSPTKVSGEFHNITWFEQGLEETLWRKCQSQGHQIREDGEAC